jgi:peptidylprolyl isomerase
VRKLSAAVLAGVLLLTVSACGQSSSSSSSSSASTSTSAAASSVAPGNGKLSDVKVEIQDGGKSAPKVTVPESLADAKASTAVLVQDGTGAAIKAGQKLNLNLAYYASTDGAAQDETTYASTQSVALTESNFANLGDAYKLLSKAKVGATVLVYAPATVTGSTGMLMVVHVSDAKEPAIAWKKSTTSSPSALEVKASGDGYAVTIPKGDAPSKLQVKVLKEGTEGEAATATSQVTAFYSGAQWDNATEFDGNFEGNETTFGLNAVIEGWTKGLTGLKAGTVVALTIPADQAYGTDSTSGRPTGPLVFIVKITKVEAAAASSSASASSSN